MQYNRIMGSGTYYAVGFGCAELPPLDDDAQLFEIFEDYGIQTSYEGATSYAIVPLLSTLSRQRESELPSAVLPVEDFAEAVKKADRRSRDREGRRNLASRS
jgi:hypothetical protein